MSFFLLFSAYVALFIYLFFSSSVRIPRQEMCFRAEPYIKALNNSLRADASVSKTRSYVMVSRDGFYPSPSAVGMSRTISVVKFDQVRLFRVSSAKVRRTFGRGFLVEHGVTNELNY